MQINILENLFNTTEKYPDKIAVIEESSSISYTELTKATINIGNALDELIPGIFQESVIVFIDKSIECLKAMFGTLYAGHYYVIMDIKTPIDRFQEIVSTLDNKVLITTSELRDNVIRLGYEGDICLVDDLEIAGQEMSDGESWKKRIDTDLAYVIFTSGTTGIPKGVAITHRSLIDYIDAFVSSVKIEEDDILGNQCPFFFDVSLKDIYMTQKTGASLCIIPSRFFMTPKKLLKYLEDNKVTILTWVPTAYRIIAQFDGLQKIRPSHLRKFIFAGETMPTYVFNYWRKEYPEATYIQSYGPTEITGACTFYEVPREFADDEIIPIGNALPNTGLFLLNENGEYISPTLTNHIGEIYVRGTCLAVGYINNSDKTEEMFVQNPLQNKYPEKVYRTGDLAYWNEQQELVFVSRKDFQIKHSGHRIELGEIENAILSIEGIDDCCCVQDRTKDEIVCFYISTILEKKDIMTKAQSKLPKYMMPSVYQKIKELPTLSNGKVDRKRLDKLINNVDKKGN